MSTPFSYASCAASYAFFSDSEASSPGLSGSELWRIIAEIVGVSSCRSFLISVTTFVEISR